MGIGEPPIAAGVEVDEQLGLVAGDRGEFVPAGWVAQRHGETVGALPRLADPSGGPVRTVPIPALDPLTVGWAVRQWNVLSPLAAEFADLVASLPPGQHPASRTD